MIFRILLILIWTEITISSLLSTNFCKISQKECFGSYDLLNRYRINCENIRCSGKYKYICGLDKCAVSRLECDMFKNLTKILRSYSQKTHFYKYLALQALSTNIAIEKEKLKQFEEKISHCSLMKYEYNSNDFCMMGNNSIEKKKIFNSIRFDYTSKIAKCKCPEGLQYNCDKYCTKNNFACDYLRDHLSIRTNLSLCQSCGINKKFIKNSLI